VIVSATVADAAALASIHAEAVAPPWSAAALAALLANPAVTGLMSGAPPVGFIMIQSAAGEAEILTLAVRPPARRAGLGRALLRAAMAQAQAAGAETMFLDVAADNAPALALYTGEGFADAGRRKGYYARASGPAVDAFVLRRTLTPQI
jgi:ribosomal-protein-alanine N-acetyltransferase